VAILTSADYPEIRAALSPDLGTDDLPDSVIGRDVYAGAAQREVIAIDPIAESRTGAEAAHIKAAAILLTAARLALRLTRVSSERIASFAATYLPQDPELLAGSLRAQAMTELGYIPGLLTDLTTTIRPTMFALASNRRGDVSIQSTLGSW
jgi:hypothetical protein